MAGEALLKLEDVRVCYGRAEALHGISIEVGAGEDRGGPEVSCNAAR